MIGGLPSQTASPVHKRRAHFANKNGVFEHEFKFIRDTNFGQAIPTLSTTNKLESLDGISISGTWGLDNSDSVSPSNSLADSPGVPYWNNISSEFTFSASSETRTAVEARLKFYLKGYI